MKAIIVLVYIGFGMGVVWMVGEMLKDAHRRACNNEPMSYSHLFECSPFNAVEELPTYEFRRE